MTARFLTTKRIKGATAVSAVRTEHGSQSRGTSIFVTGGIGDVIALSCFLELPSDLETIYYATRKRDDVQAYLETICPPNTRHVSLWDDWSHRWGWYSLAEFQRLANVDEASRLSASHTEDWSIMTVFRESLPFVGLPWSLGHPFSSVYEVTLPNRYALFQPFSSDKRDQRRDFTRDEIEDALLAAEQHRLPLVLINEGCDPLIESPWLINLQNKTNLYGSIDITIGASLYIGIDSAMSQVATKVLPAEKLLIKSVNPHYYRSLRWYAAPHTVYPFVVESPIARLNQLDWSTP
jgi:hypothetical protein